MTALPQKFKHLQPHRSGFFAVTLRILQNSFLAVLIHLIPMVTSAQRTSIYEDEIKEYNTALELFDKEKYASAQQHFQRFLSISKDQLSIVNAMYFSAVCSMELFNADAENALKQVTNQFPENPKAKLAWYQLGRFYYRNKNNKDAVYCFEKVSSSYLNEAESKEYNFDKGYCLFKMERYSDAKASFKAIKDEKSKFYDATNYYYGYVCYKSGDFNEALEHFNRIRYHKTFGPMSSVYVAQIYFSRKQYKEVIAFCDTISNKEVAVDVAGLLGQSYFQLKKYDAAIPHLEKYMEAAPVLPGNADYYQLGIAYARTKNYQSAVDQLLKIESKNDTLTQYVFYALADCYLKLGKKPNALTAFTKSSALKTNSSITEESLFNSAKIADELSLQGDAMTSYSKFIEAFPQSKHIDEARSNLAFCLVNSRNFNDAITILEKIENPTKKDQELLQQVKYFRGEELYLSNLAVDAEDQFKKALEIGLDPLTNAKCHFWLAEMAYKNQQYDLSLLELEVAQSISAFHTNKLFPLTYYNSGYAYLKKENYSKAIEGFKGYLDKEQLKSNPEIYTDALIRTADCYFIMKEYENAIQHYDVLIQNHSNGADYALYQKALILGVQGKYAEKAAVLKILIGSYPQSTYIDDAVYESANLNLLNENYEQAITSFNNLITNYPRSIYIRKARLNKGLALFNSGKDNAALDEIKTLITSYPSTDEAREGLIIVKNIYVNRGESESYLEFVKILPNVVVAASTQDSLSFESAFNLYKLNDCLKSTKSFATYISKFPGGYFIVKANYYKAECDYKLKNYDAALIGYEYNANGLRNDFTERSTRQAAVIHFMKKEYDIAYSYYAALERIASNKDNLSVSLLGQMRSSILTEKGDSASIAAFKYINSGIGQKEGLVEAHLQCGRFFLNRGKNDSAQQEFIYVLKETANVFGAEAKYSLAKIYFLKKDFKSAQKNIFELSSQFNAFNHWKAKGFMLLAEIYFKQNDFFQSKATLQSLIDNADESEIVEACKLRLAEINEIEIQQKNDHKQQVEQRIKQNENK